MNAKKGDREMTLGNKIKKARVEANLTQKELADQLSVTFQTVSKWEGGVTEPDLATLRAIAGILKVSIEYLVSEGEKPVEAMPHVAPATAPVKRQIGTCSDCRSPIQEGELFHNVERKSASGVKETVIVCDSCFKKSEEEIERRAREVEQSMFQKPANKKIGPFHKVTERNDKKPLIWGIAVGAVVFVATLVLCIVNYSSVGIGWTIALPLLLGYAVTALIYCIFTASYISDVFVNVASWSVRFPGLIFSWDLDGFMWLIAMKILFFILGVLIGVGTFLLAVFISALLSVFSFVPLLIYNKTHE